MEGGSYTEGNRAVNNTNPTNSQLIDMTQQIVKNGQPNMMSNYNKGANQVVAMQTTVRHMEGSNSPTLDQSQLSDPMQIAKAHAKNSSFINAQEDSFIQAKSPSNNTQLFYNDDRSGANTFHTKKMSNSSNNIIGQKMKTIPRKKSTGQTIEDANSKKIRELKETYHKIAKIQSNTYNNRNAKQSSLFQVNSNQGSSTNSVANRL